MFTLENGVEYVLNGLVTLLHLVLALCPFFEIRVNQNGSTNLKLLRRMLKQPTVSLRPQRSSHVQMLVMQGARLH